MLNIPGMASDAVEIYRDLKDRTSRSAGLPGPPCRKGAHGLWACDWPSPPPLTFRPETSIKGSQPSAGP